MRPLLETALLALAAAGTGAPALIWGYRRARRNAMRDAIRAPVRCTDGSVVSIFDLFWDLGASDFALELMAHRGLLLENLSEARQVQGRLPARVAEHGDYDAFVRENLDAIRPYYQGQTEVGDRRSLPALTVRERKTLALSSIISSSAAGVPRLCDVEERRASRSESYRGPIVEPPTEVVDIDEVLRTDPLRWIGSVFTGEVTDELKRWFGLRRARRVAGQLDDQLADLARLFADSVRANPGFVSHLYDGAFRWNEECLRIEQLADTHSWKDKSWAPCADVLMAEARRLAEQLTALVIDSVDDALRRIDDLVSCDNEPMAGYLIYLNRYALFAGRLDLCGVQVRLIESTAHRMQRELRECRAKELI